MEPYRADDKYNELITLLQCTGPGDVGKTGKPFWAKSILNQ